MLEMNIRHFRCWHFSDVCGAADDVSSRGAGSTGRRNTDVKSLCWGVKLQGLTWPFVELTSHFVQIGLRVHRQVGALRKVLSQQAIGVLGRPAGHQHPEYLFPALAGLAAARDPPPRP